MRLLFLLSLPAVLFLAGCNTPGCLVQDKAAEVSANFVASVLECSKVADLKKDINDDVLSKTGLCKAAEDGVPKGPLADAFCPIVTNTVVDFVKTQGQDFLTKYDCKATNAAALAKDKLLALCKQLPLSNK
jgi:hypothetical protein